MRMFLALLLTALLLAGCQPTPTPTDPILSPLLLTPADLPEGFTLTQRLINLNARWIAQEARSGDAYLRTTTTVVDSGTEPSEMALRCPSTWQKLEAPSVGSQSETCQSADGTQLQIRFVQGSTVWNLTLDQRGAEDANMLFDLAGRLAARVPAGQTWPQNLPVTNAQLNTSAAARLLHKAEMGKLSADQAFYADMNFYLASQDWVLPAVRLDVKTAFTPRITIRDDTGKRIIVELTLFQPLAEGVSIIPIDFYPPPGFYSTLVYDGETLLAEMPFYSIENTSP